MRLTRYFLPTLKETPAEAQIASHRLMLRAGMVRQAGAGIYSWLPLGFRVLKRIETIVHEEMQRAGAHAVLMPTMQLADLWRESGRYDAYGPEMLRIRDRHGRDMLYGPTNEEQITQIMRDDIQSYRDLPRNLYHIQWKFRDEIRPRFGVMRGREFLMKDAYSFDLDFESARRSYNTMFVAYLRTYARMGLRAIPLQADSGPIGGDLSHEFVILAATGETRVHADRRLLDMDAACSGIDYDGDLEPVVRAWTSLYAASDDKHDPETAPVSGSDLLVARGIEVGHIFYFGTKYSEAMGASVAMPDGERRLLHGGSYGIGVSRLAGAIIEACHDDAGIIWPDSVAPFDAGIVNLKTGDPLCDSIAAAAEERLHAAGLEVLHDDRDERAGVKFSDMDLIGLPWQIIVGPRGAASSRVELKRRADGQRLDLSLDDAVPCILDSRT
ncbi:MAG: proline--tRNA ligase [bacterium]|nr:proline--tRNA ligase [bacterium]MDE0238619.1 proline--tRNA ligase [bacterium]MDE0416791.1 proline--tRNA ligase [bacterium]